MKHLDEPDWRTDVADRDRFLPKKPSSWPTIIIFVFIAATCFIIFKQYKTKPVFNPQITIKSVSYGHNEGVTQSLSDCTPMPGRGGPTILDSVMNNKAGVPYGALTLKNDHSTPVVAVLMDISESRQLQAISVNPHGSEQVTVPSGQYGVEVFTGRDWCNLKKGFPDGIRNRVPGGLEVKGGIETLAKVETSNQSAFILFSSHQVYPDLQPQPGMLVIHKDQQNSYTTTGSLNGIQSLLVVDTGAAGLSISTDTARAIGITHCGNPTTHGTANGFVSGCEGLISSLTFGPFRLTNVKVSILPNLVTGSLLGIDVLKRFNMQWSQNTVTITATDPSISVLTGTFIDSRQYRSDSIRRIEGRNSQKLTRN